MKQSTSTTILFLFFTLAHINNANSALITPSTDFTSPALVTAFTEIQIDFGVPGSNIELLDLRLNITFDQNLLDTSEDIQIARLVNDPTLGTAWLASENISLGPPRTNYTSTLNTNLFIDTQGFGYIQIKVGGNGAIISDLSLIGNATVTAVPIPPTMLLFLSGLSTLFALKKSHKSERVKINVSNERFQPSGFAAG